MVKAHGLEKQCWFITREYDLIKRYKAALPEGQTLHWMNLGNWGYIDFNKPGECEKCEANMMALFENDTLAPPLYGSSSCSLPSPSPGSTPHPHAPPLAGRR